MATGNEDGILALLATAVRQLRRDFVALSKQAGPAGKDGQDGKDGQTGRRGPRGPAGLDGPRGPRGSDGVDGNDGADGKDGRNGKDGGRGDTGPMPKHQWQGTKLRFQLTDAKWGKWVDLKGPAGGAGGVVVVGAGNADGGGGGNPDGGWSPDLLPAAGDSTPDAYVVRQEGVWVVASHAQMSTWLQSAPAEEPPSPNSSLVFRERKVT